MVVADEAQPQNNGQQRVLHGQSEAHGPQQAEHVERVADDGVGALPHHLFILAAGREQQTPEPAEGGRGQQHQAHHFAQFERPGGSSGGGAATSRYTTTRAATTLLQTMRWTVEKAWFAISSRD